MRKFMLATAAILGLTVSASAADMALKAPPLPEFNGGSGGYIGFGTEGAVANASVSGNIFPSNLTASGASVDVDAGYIWGKCILNSWCQIELDGKYQNISASNGLASVSSHWSVSGEFDVGADVLQTIGTYFSNVPSIFPSFNPTTLLPAAAVGNVSATPRGYIGFKGEVYNLNGTIGSLSGQTVTFAPGVTAGWRWMTLTNGTPNGGSLKVFADILWPTRGEEVTGLFAAPGGAPLKLQAAAGMAQIYRVGLHYDFGVGPR